MLSIYPWQQRQWEQLQLARASERLPHAILLSGPEGIGLSHFCQCVVNSLLCANPAEEGRACGACKACVLMQAGNHPDFLKLEPEDRGKQIKVDSVRELIEYIHLSSQYGRYKLAAIEPAEAMNRSSANSLLKTLEEPPPGSLLILISHQPSLLPITIRSRCQQINMPPAAEEPMRAWLQKQPVVPKADLDKLITLSRGAPLKALDFVETEVLAQQKTVLDDLHALRQNRLDPVSTAEKWQGFGVSEVLQWLLAFFNEMIRLKLASFPFVENNSNINRQLQELTKGLDLVQLFTCYDLVLQDYHTVTGPISLNKQGLLEGIIVEWQSLTEQEGR